MSQKEPRNSEDFPESEFREKVRGRLEERFPSTKSYPPDLSRLCSPRQVTITSHQYQTIANAIQALHNVTSSDQYKNYLLQLYPHLQEVLSVDVNNPSILMCYDFHIDPSGQPKLIEINTNASGFLLSCVITEAAGLASLEKELNKFKTVFLKDLRAAAFPLKDSLQVAIVDEDPKSQKMYFEFTMYEQLFRDWGHAPIILDVSQVLYEEDQNELRGPSGRIDFVYNRYTDFYLEQPASKAMRQAFFKKACVFSPHPKRYALESDKQRLLDLNQLLEQGSIGDQASIGGASELNAIKSVLLKAQRVVDFASSEALWEQRKKYFFKPLRAFGGKSAYRGSSISHKVFDRIQGDDFVAQEFVPPPEIDGWKFDLRFFAYAGEIQLGIARVFQGQTTNFQSVGGGFSALRIE